MSWHPTHEVLSDDRCIGCGAARFMPIHAQRCPTPREGYLSEMPIKKRGKRRNYHAVMIRHRGEEMPLYQWADRVGIRRDSMRKRYKKHLKSPTTWPIDRVLSPPERPLGGER